jgi:L-ascorbate metabolism protein UlaG (beta-lactamase superfamily)
MALNRGFRLTFLGQMTFRLDTRGGTTVLLDPWVEGNPVCPPENKSFEKIDIMAISHGHGDHMADAVTFGKKFNSTIVCIPEIAHFLRKKGLTNVVGMNKGGTMKVGAIGFTMVNALHSSGIEDGGTMIYGGDPAGFVITLEDGTRIYHAGDTAVFGDMALIAELYAPEIAILPIGDHFTMGPAEAALATQLLRPKIVIPAHYGTSPKLTGTPAMLRQELAKRNLAVEVVELAPGQSLT